MSSTLTAIVVTDNESNDIINTAIPIAITPDNPQAIAKGAILFDFRNNRDIDETEDVDFYSFALNTGDTIKIDLDGTGEHPISLAELIIFDSQGNNVAQGSFLNPGFNDAFTSFLPYIEYTATQSGTYYAGVSASFNFSYDPFTKGSGSGVVFPGFDVGDYSLNFDWVKPENSPTPSPHNDFTSKAPAANAPTVSLRTMTGTYGLEETLLAQAVLESVGDLGLSPADAQGGSAITLVLTTEGDIPDTGIEVTINTGTNLAEYIFLFKPFIRGADILGPVLNASGEPTGIRLNITQKNALLNFTVLDKPEREMDGAEQVTFALEAGANFKINPDAGSSTITFYDNLEAVPALTIEPVVSLSVSSSELIETEGNTATFTFALSEPPPPEGVIVFVNTETTSLGEFVEGQDFQGLGQFDIFNADVTGGAFPSSNFTSSGLYFKITEQTATVTAAAFPDASTEGIQAFKFFLEPGVGYQIDSAANSAIVTIADTADSLIQVSLTTEPAVLVEAEKTVSIHKFNLSAPPPEGLTITVTINGLEDFDLAGIVTTGITGELQVLAGAPPKLRFTITAANASIQLPIVQDDIAEALETATFSLNPGAGYQISATANQATFQIVETPEAVPPSPIEIEFNDTLATAIAVNPIPDQPVAMVGEIGYVFDFFSGNPIIDPSEDVDFYSFKLKAGETIAIDVDANASGEQGITSLLHSVIRVFDESGNELKSAGQVEALGQILPGQGDPRLEFTASKDGTYYAGISLLGNDRYDPAILGSGSGWTFRDLVEPDQYQVSFSTSLTDVVDLGYVNTVLVSNNPAYNPQLLDPDVQLAWGIAIRPAGFGGHFWINNSATGTVTEYVGDVGGVPLYQDDLKVIDIAFAPGNPFEVSGPTGQVFNGSNEFMITQDHPNGAITAASKFIFVTTDGTISAWTERKNPDGSFDRALESEIVVNQFGSAIYYGVAITDFQENNRLYAVDFDATPGIQVFDGTFKEISNQIKFTNPFASAGYIAYNIQTLGNSLYVTYAQPSSVRPGDEVVGTGLGRLAQFDFNGNLIATWNDGGLLNAPWGLTIAPADFGEFSNALLVANFGDGTIAAFDPATRQPLGYLEDSSGEPIAIPGIWGILFGNGASLGEANHLYYAAGPDTGSNAGDGLFGKIQLASTVETFPGGNQTFYGDDQDNLLQISGNNNQIFAGTGQNTITARGVNQTIYAGTGDDIISIGSGTVYAGSGNNFVAASSGASTLYTESGNDTINVLRGNSIVYAGEGANTIYTGAGDDLIYAGAAADTIHAGGGTNVIHAGDGNNSITSVGNDTIYVGSGVDRWTFSAGAGVATVIGFGSNDKIDLSGYRSDFTGALTVADLTMIQSGADTIVKLTATEDLLAILKWTEASAISSSNFL